MSGFYGYGFGTEKIERSIGHHEFVIIPIKGESLIIGDGFQLTGKSQSKRRRTVPEPDRMNNLSIRTNTAGNPRAIAIYNVNAGLFREQPKKGLQGLSAGKRLQIPVVEPVVLSGTVFVNAIFVGEYLVNSTRTQLQH